MNIKKTDFVLEIGSGNKPNPRSDILVDRYLYDNGQRAGEFKIVVDRPFIVADGYKLPFKDKVFDYVICSHILEHLVDPQKFLDELVRVGKAGYIEVPSDFSERIFGWNFHLWYCSLENGGLVLKKKKEGEQFGGFFHKLIAKQIWFRRFFEEHEDKFYIKHEWKHKINLSIQGSPTKKFLDKLDNQVWKLLEAAKPNLSEDMIFYGSWMKKRAQRKARKIFRRFLWIFKKTTRADHIIENIYSFFSCPMCSSRSFTKTANNLTCDHCHTAFPLIGVIPIMLTVAERKRGW